MSTMQRYMEQLIDDIRESAANSVQNSEQFAVPMPPGVPEHLRHLPVIPEKKAYEWFDLSLEMFPPADRWNDYQLLFFCVILRSLFEHYNIQVEIPNYLPYDQVYTFLLKALDSYTSCLPETESLNVITFCECDEDTCPFGEYCAKESEYHCDTWALGQYWDGYIELEVMEKNKKEPH